MFLWSASVFGAAAQPAPAIRLEGLRVQLLYERTGTLSPNIAPPSTFSLWNTCVGEGSAAEPANDALVSVVLASTTEEANASLPVVLTVRGPGGRVLARRSFDHVFLSHHRAVRSVLVPDVGCGVGAVTIEAVFGSQRRTARLNFDGGE